MCLQTGTSSNNYKNNLSRPNKLPPSCVFHIITKGNKLRPAISTPRIVISEQASSEREKERENQKLKK